MKDHPAQMDGGDSDGSSLGPGQSPQPQQQTAGRSGLSMVGNMMSTNALSPFSPAQQRNHGMIARRSAGSFSGTQTAQFSQHLQGQLTTRDNFEMDSTFTGRRTPIGNLRGHLGASPELGFIQTMAHQQEVLVKAVLDQNDTLAATFKSVTDNLQQLSLTNAALVGELKDMRRDQNESTKLFFSELRGEREEMKSEKEDMKREKKELRREMEDIRRERDNIRKEEAEHRDALRKELAEKEKSKAETERERERAGLLPPPPVQPLMTPQYPNTGAFWPVHHHQAAVGYPPSSYMTPPPPGVYGPQPTYYHGQTGSYQGPTGLAAMTHMLQNQYAEEPSLSADEVAAYTRQILGQQTQSSCANISIQPSPPSAPAVTVSQAVASQSVPSIPSAAESSVFAPQATSSLNPAANVKEEADIRLQFGTPTTPALQQKTENKPGTGFPGIGTKVFGGSPDKPPARKWTVSESEDDSSHYEPNVTFEPAVPLPDLIEIQTGEEEEEVLFSERGKLFRFVKETGEFKERGVGDLKILKHRETGKIRVVMRREQVLKLCANFYITPDMKLTPMAKSDRAFLWTCQDYSEGELSLQTLAARFKTPELAHSFHSVFTSSVEQMSNRKNTPQKAPQTKEGAKGQSPKDDQPAAPQKSLAEMFKKKPGTWECKVCYVMNGADKTVCPACSHDKEGKPQKGGGVFGSPISAASTTTPTQFSFGLGSKPAGATSTPTPVAEKAGGLNLSFGNVKACEPDTKKDEGQKAKPFGGFSFKLPASTTPKAKGEENKGLSFGTPKSGEEAKKEDKGKTTGGGNVFQSFTFKLGSSPTTRKEPAQAQDVKLSFGTPAAPGSTPKPKTAAEGGSVFGQMGSTGTVSFASLSQSDGGTGKGFGSSPLSSKGFQGTGEPLFSKGAGERPSLEKSRERQESTGEDSLHFEPNVSFEPVVPLPDLVEVQTGEEEEEALFSERGKLFRFVKETGEFKERGVGDLKILKHRETGKIRVVMRREQVLKLCANFYITPDMKLTPMAKSDRAFLWTCQDYSEGELSLQTLAARFKTPELAHSFHSVFTSSVEQMSNRKNTPQKAPQTKEEDGGKKAEGFGDMFKKKEGAWDCESCLASNDPTASVCVCCETGKDGKALSAFGKSIFGKTAPVLFGNSAGTPEGQLGVSFGFGLGKAGETKTSPPQFGFGGAKEDCGKEADLSIEAVKEVESVSEEQAERARALELPRNFYAFENKREEEECGGCLGCKDEEETDRILDVLHRLGEEKNARGDVQNLCHIQATWQRVKPATNKTENVLGEISLSWDHASCAYRVVFRKSSGGVEMDHLILQDARVESGTSKKRPTATWTLPEGKKWKEMSLIFSSVESRDEFMGHFRTGVKIAGLGGIEAVRQCLHMEADANVDALKALMNKAPGLALEEE